MTKSALVGLVLLSPLLVAAPPVPQNPALESRFSVKLALEPVDEEPDEATFTVTNNSHAPIVALLIACPATRSSTGEPRTAYLYSDSVLATSDFRGNKNAREILYQESASFEVNRMYFRAINCKLDSLKAILFADGTSFGDKEWVDQITHVREYVWRRIGDLTSLLQAAVISQTATNQFAETLNQIEWQEETGQTKEPVVRDLGAPNVFHDIYYNLRIESDVESDAPVTQSVADALLEPALDLRQRLLYSKPRLSVIQQDPDPAGAPSPDFIISFLPHKGPIQGEIRLWYWLDAKDQSGNSGMDDFYPPKESNPYHIHTLVGSKAALALHATIYEPGCQIKVIDVPDLSASSRTDTFECVTLPTITFKGQILPTNLLERKEHAVEIELSFFRLFLTTVFPDKDGVFEAHIPDFSHDPVCGQGAQGHGCVLHFYASPKNSNVPILAELAAVDNAADSDGDLQLKSDYGGVVTFHARPAKQ
jgi:hypothetical protein